MWELPPGEGWQVEPQFISTRLEDEEKQCQPLPAHVMVTKACQVGEVSAAIRRASWVALDTESNQQFVYMPRVCLLQINAQNSLFILDTIALYQEDPSGSCLESLWRALRHPHSIFVHGGDNDVSCLKRDFNVSLTRLFDTHQAAKLLKGVTKYEEQKDEREEKRGGLITRVVQGGSTLRLLHFLTELKSLSYGGLVSSLLGVELAKDWTHYNWGMRPIDTEALRYALEDVIYLPLLGQELIARINQGNLQKQMSKANRYVESCRAFPKNVGDPSLVYDYAGAGNFDERQLSVLVALFIWRDNEAKRMDCPSGIILANSCMVKIARMTDVNLVYRYGGGRYARELIACIGEALRNPPEVSPNRQQQKQTQKTHTHRPMTTTL